MFNSILWIATHRVGALLFGLTIFADCVHMLRLEQGAHQNRWRTRRRGKSESNGFWSADFWFAGVAPIFAVAEGSSCVMLGLISALGQYGTYDLNFDIHSVFLTQVRVGGEGGGRG